MKLFLILAVATSTVWVFAAIWIQTSTRSEVERVLDARLYEAAHMVSSLLSDRRIEVAQAGTGLDTIPLQSAPGYSRQLSCQIWALDGSIVGQSSGAPQGRLTEMEAEGYSQSDVNGEPWRVYSMVNEALGVRIMVGDSLAVRDRLIWDVLEGLLLPGALILPVLAIILWFSVARGMAPIERLAADLRRRAPEDLSAIPDVASPPEIRSVLQALNALFSKVAAARDVERDFTTYAAHELKTPLAGLRTQAQIMRMSDDPAVRANALNALERSVDRTDRMVRQLLELSIVEQSDLVLEDVDLKKLIAETVVDLKPMASTKLVSLTADTSTNVVMVKTNSFLLQTALRNVIENAIHASPIKAEVRIMLDGTAISVVDDGPGMDGEYLSQMKTRFKRGREGSPGGSGLGLSIVASAMERLGGQFSFKRAESRGQIVRLIL